MAAKRGEAQTLHSVVAQLSAHAATWPTEVQPQWIALQAAAAGPDPRAAAVRIAFLRNSLMRVPDFRQSLGAIQPPAGNEAPPFTHFLLLPGIRTLRALPSTLGRGRTAEPGEADGSHNRQLRPVLPGSRIFSARAARGQIAR